MRSGRLPALSGARRDVARAWVAYWSYAGHAFLAAHMDRSAQDAVTTGAARRAVTGYTEHLASSRHHVVGQVTIEVSTVRVTGDSATVCGPVLDHSFEVDAKGHPTESVLGHERPTRGGLVRRGGSWLVSTSVVVRAC